MITLRRRGIGAQLKRTSAKQMAIGFGASLLLAAVVTGSLSLTRNAEASVWDDNGQSSQTQAANVPATPTGNQSSVWSAGSNSNTGDGSPSTPADTANNPAPQASYAALGDSVAAGLGLPLAANATAADKQCGRSSQAYPAIVAQQLGLPLTFVACSGATAGDLTTQQRVAGTNPQRQIDTAFANGTPSLISVTAGANDIHWQDFIKKCYAMACGGSVDNATLTTLLATVRVKLAYFLAETKVRSGGKPPRVVLTGYYYPVSSQCATTQFTPAEISWLRGSADRLNQVIRQTAASYSFTRFAPANFSGHDLCSAEPWIQGLHDAAPIHPTAQGQRVIANSVIQAAR